MILNTANINKSFGSNEILKNASIVINEKEKVAIVGFNGAGKTTFMKILAGIDPADSGTVTLAKGAKLSYLSQINNIDSELTILEELTTVIQPILDMEERLSKISEDMKYATGEELEKLYENYSTLSHSFELLDGYHIKSKVRGILNGLGFLTEDFDKTIKTLSGGQKTRVFLAKILLEEPDIILLDEPTNHLDLFSIEWLETYLTNYKGAVVIVSHDRYFLNKIVTKVIDIENGDVNTYLGNYSEFSTKKEMLRLARIKEYEKQQEEIKHQEEVIDKLKSFNREKSIKRAESREKQLNKIERMEKPIDMQADMKLSFKSTLLSGKDVLFIENLSKSFENKHLFSNLNFELKRGEHVAIIGENGTGKTTILKIINGFVEPDIGHVNFGSNVFLAYYDQEHQVLHDDKTIFDEISDTYPDINNTRIRNLLAAFLFTGDAVFKKISSLSGGERARVSLAKLMLSRANLLILDEPTNHLDIVSKEILENAIKNFEGTVLYVSHDRYFINQTANRILNLKNGKLLNYIGNYDYYLEKRENLENINFSNESSSSNTTATISSSKESWQANKEEQAKLKKQKKLLEKCESNISKFEESLASINELFLDTNIQNDLPKLIKLQKEKEEIEEKLNSLYEEWEELASIE